MVSAAIKSKDNSDATTYLRAMGFICSGLLWPPPPDGASRPGAQLGLRRWGGGTASHVPGVPATDRCSGMDYRLQGDGVWSSACPTSTELALLPPDTHASVV